MGMFVSDSLTSGNANTGGQCIFATTATLGPDEDPLVTTPNNLEGLTHPCNGVAFVNGASTTNIVLTGPAGPTTLAYAGADTSTGGGLIYHSDISIVRIIFPFCCRWLTFLSTAESCRSWAPWPTELPRLPRVQYVATSYSLLSRLRSDAVQHLKAYTPPDSISLQARSDGGTVSVTGGDPHVFTALLPAIELHSTIAALAGRGEVENVDVTLLDTLAVSVTAMITRQPMTERFFYTSLGVVAGERSAEVSFQEVGGRAYASVSAGDFTFVCGQDGDEVHLSVGNRYARACQHCCYALSC